ncbi:hypothetical protein FALBO_14426 [Fusarium albosuccineum]|uniref:Uncharacterized protein n=1 Tax=Fusarium albosuccineum TaxID=1237068 RepID=A0A8H4L052_9HYPO|nr:hypothetical protein FALBO_14426 [Fusarium albosuccineum]KAF5005403.1 hypothetical protein FDECE_8150 [Fusarium decemcellulare]
MSTPESDVNSLLDRAKQIQAKLRSIEKLINTKTSRHRPNTRSGGQRNHDNNERPVWFGSLTDLIKEVKRETQTLQSTAQYIAAHVRAPTFGFYSMSQFIPPDTHVFKRRSTPPSRAPFPLRLAFSG